ncbi:TonB-dependent receptor [Massilia sp. CFBP9012]|uniref:TonB-dependent receptor n=1 Tax=Massilia sp. CFBP9012 TaxID=3096531 RepID=UPI002A6AFDEF|nr:TonB-dependent receptor [Massilia sp. CFBP9012]MDY0976888.1 TonB-dependent receptor [Massilia sp. CFBP9012]
MTDFTGKRTPLALACLLALGAPLTAHAQSTAAPATAAPATVIVSASGLGVASDDMVTPVTSIGGNELVRTRQSTLGETLSSMPGITSSHFGAGASRPIIRGMDGPRVKILSDGSEIQDASTISPDHAVAFEPVLAERIEVLRGPSALAYGGGAVGGVVNIIDRKVPTAMPEGGLEGSAEVRANSAAREKTGAAEFTVAAGSNLALHLEGVKRDADDYRVGKDWQGGRRVPGSDKETETGTVGLSWVGQNGYLGAAFTKERGNYGLPGHGFENEAGEIEAPVVDLDSERWDVRGEYRNPVAGIERVRLRASFTDYIHDEVEGSAVATTFKNKGHDGRLEFVHAPIAGWHGVFGLQTTRRDFSAIGAEAYVPPTLTKKHAAFLTEEYKLGNVRFEAAVRHEWQDVDVEVDKPDSHTRGTSLSVGAVWKFAPEYSLGTSLSHTHRLPTAEELFADGPHLATNTYEIGNPNLVKETSNNLDLTLRKFAGRTTFSLSAFHNRIGDYIYSQTRGEFEGLQLINYAQRDATFTGLEGEVAHKLSSVWKTTLFGDYVRARFDEGPGSRDIPRTPAHRIGVKLEGDWGAWNGLAELVRVGKQDKIAEFETETPGYTTLNLSTHYSTRIGTLPAQLYLRLNNVTDRLAYSHTSFIKDYAPLTGRNLTAGLRVLF